MLFSDLALEEPKHAEILSLSYEISAFFLLHEHMDAYYFHIN